MFELKTQTILIATKNQGKVKEFQAFFAELGWHVEPAPADAPDVVEDGQTFAANAQKKAEEISRHYNCPALADDSGLEVDALQGRPGVYSARYSGENATDASNNAKLLQEMAGFDNPDDRAARFVSAIAFARPGQDTVITFGTVEGRILTEQRGEGGFGYDPLFLLPDEQKTLAEISLEHKNRISHRAEALRNMVDTLKAEQAE
ncbi:MAG TPA: XTP/dITP diphosphatase [Bacilli bacterium]|nr:XTP/dITP diphosphatase [Bacilli bacterium]